MTAVLMLLLIAGIWFCFRRKGRTLSPKILGIAVLFEVFSLAVGFSDGLSPEDTGTIKRPLPGEGSAETTLEAVMDGETQTVTLTVQERQLSAREKEALLEEAASQIDSLFPGENEGLDVVTQDLNLPSSLCEGQVQVQWSFWPAALIEEDGTLNRDGLTEDAPAAATAWLTCQGEERWYSFPFVIKAPDEASPAGRLARLAAALSESDVSSAGEEIWTLPQEIAGTGIRWRIPKENTPFVLALLGPAAIVGTFLGQYRDRESERRKNQRLLDADYPQVVSDLSLFVGAGVHPANALSRMRDAYVLALERGEKKKPGMEQIRILCRQLSEGMGEEAAYMALGDRCPTRYWQKLSVLLSQSVRLGDGRLAQQLEQEEERALELRRQMAQRAGQETSTKLLVPLVGMLGVLMAMLVVPALWGISL